MDGVNKPTTLQQELSTIEHNDILTSLQSYYFYDRISMTIYLMSVLIPATFLNITVIYLTKIYHQFHTPYMYVKAISAMLDMMFGWGLVPHSIIDGHFGISFSSRFVCYSSNVGIAAFCSTAQFTAVVALERYLFFCKPFVYQRWVTLKSTVVISVIMILLAQIYIISTEIVYGRELQIVFAICQLKDQAFHSTLQFALFFVPSIVATIFSIHNITKLIKKVDIGPVQDTNITNTESVMQKHAAKRGVRLVN